MVNMHASLNKAVTTNLDTERYLLKCTLCQTREDNLTNARVSINYYFHSNNKLSVVFCQIRSAELRTVDQKIVFKVLIRNERPSMC